MYRKVSVNGDVALVLIPLVLGATKILSDKKQQPPKLGLELSPIYIMSNLPFPFLGFKCKHNFEGWSQPDLTTSDTGTPAFCAIYPSTENMAKPPYKLVPSPRKVISTASLKTQEKSVEHIRHVL